MISSRRSYDNPSVSYAEREIWNGIEINRIGSAGLGKRSKWTRAVDFATFLFSCSWRLLRFTRQDIVIALTSPPLISVLGALTARRWKAKFFYWVMDFNPDEAIAAGWLRANSVPARILDRMSRFSLHNAERVIALDRFMKSRIVNKGIPSDRVLIIPPWAHDDDVQFNLQGRTQFRSQHDLQDKFVVMYSGNHSPVHPLQTLLEAAKLLKTKKEIAFLFIGGGSQFAVVKQYAKDNDLKNIKCLPYQPLNQLSASLSAADLHTVVMGNSMVGLVHPCKIYNILGVGSPFLYIGPAQSHISEIISAPENRLPSASHRHGDVEGVANSILRLSAGGPSMVRQNSNIQSLYSKQAWLPRFLTQLGCSPKTGNTADIN